MGRIEYIQRALVSIIFAVKTQILGIKRERKKERRAERKRSILARDKNIPKLGNFGGKSPYRVIVRLLRLQQSAALLQEPGSMQNGYSFMVLGRKDTTYQVLISR